MDDDVQLEQLIEAGRVEQVPPNVQIHYDFEKEYTSVPAVIVTPSTDNNGNNYPIPRVHDVSTGGFVFSFCLDSGVEQCDVTASPESFDIVVFDKDVASTLSWIDVGEVSASVNGFSTPVSFDITFPSIPYVRTTPQTSSQQDKIAATSWVHNVSTTSMSLIGCVHPGSGDSCGAGPFESFAYVAIDPISALLFWEFGDFSIA